MPRQAQVRLDASSVLISPPLHFLGLGGQGRRPPRAEDCPFWSLLPRNGRGLSLEERSELDRFMDLEHILRVARQSCVCPCPLQPVQRL
jgi:hypothetical protein